MSCCVKYLSCLLLSLATGCATYALGAVCWSVWDPHGAGAKLLFTIPIALAGMAIPGITGLLCVAFHCDFIADPEPTTPALRPAPAPASTTVHTARTSRARLSTVPATQFDSDDIELALAT